MQRSKLIESPHRLKVQVLYDSEGEARPLMVICPGGGFSCLSDREGLPIAQAFYASGFQCAIVEYRTGVNGDLGFGPMHDLAWAVGTLRDEAETLNFAPDKVSAIGFSAGGHVVGMLAAYGESDEHFTWEEQKRCHLNAALFCYAVLSGGEYAHARSFNNLSLQRENWGSFSIEKHVTDKFPPSFIWHTQQDQKVSVHNALLLSRALLEQKIPCELHIFPWGLHGLSLATPELLCPEDGITEADLHAAHWLELSCEWLKRLYALGQQRP